MRRQRARVALDSVGLKGHYDDRPIELFAAQQQKALIARALINDPPILLDDEPTSDLDKTTELEIMKLIEKVYAEGHRTIVMVTHTLELASYATKVRTMDNGVLSE